MVSAIVLAAGSSRRMGNRNKLLLPYKGQTVIALVVGNLLSAGMGEVIVVTGFEATLVEEAVKDLPVRVIPNPDYEEGMTGSIQTGVREAKGDGYLICLSDMVLIEPEEYALLKNTFEQQQGSLPNGIWVPVWQGEKGNPVLFSQSYKDLIINHAEKEGCKSIVRSHPENINLVIMPSGHILKGMDSPEEYSSLINKPEI
ncbi:nucleotidyltransferase family protein [Flavitalea flava]